jgi:hypothetical protein
MSKTRRRVLIGAGALVLAGAGTAIGLIVTAPTCAGDPAAMIAGLPSGAVWHGSGCYDTAGITLTKPVTLDGGTYVDTVTTVPIKPIIRIKDTARIQVENVTLSGENERGVAIHSDLVNEEGVQLLSSSNVTLTNVAVQDTYGDGLTFGFQPGVGPSTNVTVDGYVITNAGREGVTVAYLTDSVLNHVSTTQAWDFESDVAAGSGNVTVNEPTGKGFRLIEALSGPITFNDPNVSGHVQDIKAAASSGQPVSVNGGTVLIPRTIRGTPPGGIWVDGPGNLTFTGTTIGRQAGTAKVTGLAWIVDGGGHLTLTNSPVTPPLGIHDATSTVTINP